MWSLCMFSQTVRVVDLPRIDCSWGLLSTRAACIGRRPPHWRPRPGIFLMAGVGLERDLLVLFGELKFAWFVSTTGARWKGYGWWLRLLLSGHPWRVRAMPVAPQQGFQPALSVTILAGHTAGNCSLVGPGLAISLRNRLGKSSSIWQPANLSPTLTTTHLLYCKSIQYQYSIIIYSFCIQYTLPLVYTIHYVQTLSARLKLWFWVLVLRFIVLQDWNSFPAISSIFVR